MGTGNVNKKIRVATNAFSARLFPQPGVASTSAAAAVAAVAATATAC